VGPGLRRDGANCSSLGVGKSVDAADGAATAEQRARLVRGLTEILHG
jgi:hypothetical protein